MHRVRAIATDYDETIAEHGFVPQLTLRAMERFRASGRLLILDTGRGLEDLTALFPELDRFDRIVAENGAVLYDPGTKIGRVLAPPLAPAFLADLGRRGVEPIPKRQVIVDTWAVHHGQIREAIREAGLDYQLIYNKDSVMVLPNGVDKGTGLKHALTGTGVSPFETAGIGDAQNDFELLAACGIKVAVPHAIPALTREANHTMSFVELVDSILSDTMNPK
ncbi:MAG: HAD hydrolase family protein [Acidobacteriota bacterium]|nr:HAD hydrolase family protein [Acidobacteriota bacterium]